MTETQAGRGQLKPDEAAVLLHDVLVDVPAFDVCSGPVEAWPEEFRRRRFPIWDLWPRSWQQDPPVQPCDAWHAYGRGNLAMWGSDQPGAVGCVAPGAFAEEQRAAVKRVLAARAEHVPDHIRAALARCWRVAAQRSTKSQEEPEVYLRNDWHERRRLVAGVMPRIIALLPLAARSVRSWRGGETAIHALIHDDLLHDETRDYAVRALRRVPAVAQMASVASPVVPAVSATPPPDVKRIYCALDDLWIEVARAPSDAGLEVFDVLFGTRSLHDDLAAFAKRSGEFKARFRGPGHPYKIGDFAVTSGHEAVCCFAERVAHRARVRRMSISRVRDELAAATGRQDELAVARKEAELQRVAEDLSRQTLAAFDQWHEARNWIARSLEEELADVRDLPDRLAAPSDGKQSGVQSTSTEGRFRRIGTKHWDVALRESAGPVPDSKGMRYIQALLASVNEPVHSWTLANGTPPPPDQEDPVIDDQALKAIRTMITQTEAEREETQDLMRRADLETRLVQMRGHLTRATRGSGRRRVARNQRSATEQVREAVGKAIQRALAMIVKEAPGAGAHLTDHIKNPTGMSPCYSCPRDRPLWDLHDRQQPAPL